MTLNFECTVNFDCKESVKFRMCIKIGIGVTILINNTLRCQLLHLYNNWLLELIFKIFAELQSFLAVLNLEQALLM